MSQQQTHPLYVATRRLVGAMDRLENNLRYVTLAGQQEEGHEEQIQYFERENATLRQERENLNAAIAQLQRQYNDLHHVASTIYSKLDDSIRRLTEIIESE